MHAMAVVAAMAVALGVAATGTPALAKTCKDEVVTAKSRSTAKVSDAARERRARDRAITNWSTKVRNTHGWTYRFWVRSEEQKVECGGTEKSRHCVVSAKPCRLY